MFREPILIVDGCLLLAVGGSSHCIAAGIGSFAVVAGNCSAGFVAAVGGSGRLVAAGLLVDVGAVVPIVVAQCSLSVGIFLSGKV